MLRIISRRATELFTIGGGDTAHKPGPLKSLLNPFDEDGSEWENQFEGRIHCEAYLAVKLQLKSRVSRYCPIALVSSCTIYLIFCFRATGR